MGLWISILAGVLPMAFYAWLLYYLDRYEKEPVKLLLGVFGWGALIAASVAFLINTLTGTGIYFLTGSEFATQLTVSTLIAPVVEETLKGFAVLIVYLIFRSEFDSPLDGLIYGGITALGFAATENVWYIFQYGYLEGGWEGLLGMTLIRSVLVGWQHPFYTAFIGLGFALSRRSTEQIWRWVSPLAGWFLAVTFHLIHNLLASLLRSRTGMTLASIWDWSGYLGLALLISFLIKREQRWMKDHLQAEVANGFLAEKHYEVACSAWKQGQVSFRALFRGNYGLVRRYYQLCGDLMHKKRQLVRHGDQLGTVIEIQRLRSEIRDLREQIQDANLVLESWV